MRLVLLQIYNLQQHFCWIYIQSVFLLVFAERKVISGLLYHTIDLVLHTKMKL